MNDGSLILELLKFRNFLSFGSDETVINLQGNDITVIMGQNFDTGGEDSRNGVGKSTIADAICYVLFGEVIRGISNPKLIHNLARKRESMYVELIFRKGKYTYKIYRGERPSVLRLYRKETGEDEFEEFDTDGSEDKTKKKLELKKDIISIIGFDIDLAEYLLINSSESTPFLKLKDVQKRSIIESLFGFTILSEKGTILSEERRNVKRELASKESSVAATEQANRRVKSEIEQLENKSENWERKKAENIRGYEEHISNLEKADIEEEIEVLTLIDTVQVNLKEIRIELNGLNSECANVTSQIRGLEKDEDYIKRDIFKLEHDLEHVASSTCPTCGQDWEQEEIDYDSIKKQIEEKKNELKKINTNLEVLRKALDSVNDAISNTKASQNDLNSSLSELNNYELTYDTIEEASNADSTLKNFRKQLEDEKAKENPYLESIANMKKNVLVDIDYSEVEKLKSLVEHYTLLINLLTNTDSFLRKKIIDRFLPKLNRYITYYLKWLELEHRVVFNTDLSVEITNYNQEYDYGNLSKGERNRLGFALNLSFQDIFQEMNYKINFLIIDELIDSGICNRGAANSVEALKHIAGTNNKKIFLITHREDVASKVNDVMLIRKRNHVSKIYDKTDELFEECVDET